MGNNLAPTLAIIYMNEIDSMILDRTNGDVVLKRFIDDYFALLLSQQMSAERLLIIANDLNDAIKFSLEKPINNQLPFLDTMVSFNPSNKTFPTELYIKPIHSRCITPWDSHGSIASKKAVLIGEIRRAVTRSTSSASRKESLDKITRLFVDNGYPKKFVKSVMRHTLSKNPEDNNTQKKDDQYIYLKLPFISEEFKRRALSVVRRSGIDNVRIHFMNGKPSSRVFAPPKEKANCPPQCELCTLATRPNLCRKKNVVYAITCSHCQAVYIGETGRTIGSRVKEHLSMKGQTVYKHIQTHGTPSRDQSTITWAIIHDNIPNQAERRCIEAFEIKKQFNNIMNGCIGRTISI